jgi:hypothetical protein
LRETTAVEELKGRDRQWLLSRKTIDFYTTKGKDSLKGILFFLGIIIKMMDKRGEM